MCTDAHTQPCTRTCTCTFFFPPSYSWAGLAVGCINLISVCEMCYLSHIGAPWCCWLTAACCVEVRCALPCCCCCCRGSVRPLLYLSPGCSVSPHLIPFAGPLRNRFIRKKDLRAGRRWNHPTLCVFGTEVSSLSLYIFFYCNNNRPEPLSLARYIFRCCQVWVGHLTASLPGGDTWEEKTGVKNFGAKSIKCPKANRYLFSRVLVSEYKGCNRKTYPAVWGWFFFSCSLFHDKEG